MRLTLRLVGPPPPLCGGSPAGTTDNWAQGIESLFSFDGNNGGALGWNVQWVAALNRWRATASDTGGLGYYGQGLMLWMGAPLNRMRAQFPILSGLLCTRTVVVDWYPGYFAAEQVTRASMDERDGPGGPLWSWETEVTTWPGLPYRWVKGTGNLWRRAHVRGLTFKVGSQVGPRFHPQSTILRALP